MISNDPYSNACETVPRQTFWPNFKSTEQCGLYSTQKVNVDKGHCMTARACCAQVRAKMGHNSCKNEFRFISLICTYFFIVNIYLSFKYIMFCNGRHMTKCHSFRMTMTTTMPMARPWQYLGFSLKTAKPTMQISASCFLILQHCLK